MAEHGYMGRLGWLYAIRYYHPVLAVILTPLACLLVTAGVHWSSLDAEYWTLPVFAWFLLGIAYTHFFEYGYHRFLMHAGTGRLEFIKRNHLQHHRVFHGANFTSRDREDWRYIASPFYVFPVLFALHYALLRMLLPPKLVVIFFGGVVLHYVFFEATHWLTHIEGNAVDKFLLRVPLLGTARDYHIRHHRYHHEIPTMDFNFNPPFLGDIVGGTLKVPPPGTAPDTDAVPLEPGHTR